MIEFLKDFWCDFVVLALGLLGTGFMYTRYKTTKYVLFITYIPNLWTSLGILGTFVSIYISLRSLNFQSVVDVSKLVEMIAPAFSTSIIGIIGALASSLWIRLHRASVEVKEDDSYAATIKNIERHVGVMGSGAKEMAREMGREVVAAAGEGLRTSMLQHMRAMVGALEKEEKHFNKVSNQIVTNLRLVTNEHKASMQEMLTKYTEEAGSVKKQCEDAIKEIKDNMCATVNTVADEHTRQINAITEKQIAHMDSIDESIKASVNEAYASLAKQVLLATEELSKVTVMLPDIRADFEQTGQSVRVASDSFVQIKTDLEKVRNELKAAVDENSRRMEGTISFVDKTIKRDAENTAKVELLLKRADSAIDNMEAASVKMLAVAGKATKTSSVKAVTSSGNPPRTSTSSQNMSQYANTNKVTNHTTQIKEQHTDETSKSGVKKIFASVFSKRK